MLDKEYKRLPACHELCKADLWYDLELLREKQVCHCLCCRATPRDAEQHICDAWAKRLIGGVARERDDDTSRSRRPCDCEVFIWRFCSRDAGDGGSLRIEVVWCYQLEINTRQNLRARASSVGDRHRSEVSPSLILLVPRGTPFVPEEPSGVNDISAQTDRQHSWLDPASSILHCCCPHATLRSITVFTYTIMAERVGFDLLRKASISQDQHLSCRHQESGEVLALVGAKRAFPHPRFHMSHRLQTE